MSIVPMSKSTKIYRGMNESTSESVRLSRLNDCMPTEHVTSSSKTMGLRFLLEGVDVITVRFV